MLEDLNKLVLKHEASNSSYLLNENNQEFVAGLINGIVGFKLKIHRFEGIWKLSQNHSKERQQRVISNLEQIRHDNAREIAAQMKVNLKRV